jgi:hypothetical protein
VLYPRWPPLLNIEISSNGQNCSILSQNVPKFEMYKHNDELFNTYYRIFYELKHGIYVKLLLAMYLQLKFELIFTYTKAAMDN